MTYIPQHITDPLQWGTVAELSHLLQRPIQTVYWLLRTGSLSDFGIASYRDANGKWWVKIPDELRPVSTIMASGLTTT